MRRPILSDKVMRGLLGIVSVIEAGGPEDFMGYSEEQMDRDGDTRAAWHDVLRACEWINDTNTWRATKKKEQR